MAQSSNQRKNIVPTPAGTGMHHHGLPDQQIAADRALQHVLMQVPAAIAITRGSEHRFENANVLYQRLTGKRELIGKTVREVFPELQGQGFCELMDAVYATGEAHVAREVCARWDRRGN